MAFKRKYGYIENDDFQAVQTQFNYRARSVSATPEVTCYRTPGHRNYERKDDLAFHMRVSKLGQQLYPDYQQSAPPFQSISQEDLRKVIDEFVRIYERVNIDNDAKAKPNYSYTELIFLAIMRSTNFCLPIPEIYRYIETLFAFFRNCTRQHWKNAVCHSLSKTKCFTKIGIENQKKRNGIFNRSSCLWTILPRSLLSFVRGVYRNCDKGRSPISLEDGFHQSRINGCLEECVLSLANRIDALKYTLNNSPSPIRIFQLQTCDIPETWIGQGSPSCAQTVRDPVPEATQDNPPSPCRKRHKAMVMSSTPSATPRPIDFTMAPTDFSFASSPGCTNSANPTISTGTTHDSGYDSPIAYSPEPTNSPPVFHSSPRLSCEQVTYQSTPSADINHGLPEVLPGCIYSILEVPDLPSLRLCNGGTTNDNFSVNSKYLPYATNSEAATTPFLTNCMFETSGLSTLTDSFNCSSFDVGNFSVFEP